MASSGHPSDWYPMPQAMRKALHWTKPDPKNAVEFLELEPDQTIPERISAEYAKRLEQLTQVLKGPEGQVVRDYLHWMKGRVKSLLQTAKGAAVEYEQPKKASPKKQAGMSHRVGLIASAGAIAAFSAAGVAYTMMRKSEVPSKPDADAGKRSVTAEPPKELAGISKPVSEERPKDVARPFSPAVSVPTPLPKSGIDAGVSTKRGLEAIVRSPFPPKGEEFIAVASIPVKQQLPVDAPPAAPAVPVQKSEVPAVKAEKQASSVQAATEKVSQVGKKVKMPIPDADGRAAAEQKAQELLAGSSGNAKQIAESLLIAGKTAKDGAEKWVLLVKCYEQAILAGNQAAAFSAIDDLARSFEGGSSLWTGKKMEAVQKILAGGRLTPQERRDVVQSTLPVIQQAFDANDFEAVIAYAKKMGSAVPRDEKRKLTALVTESKRLLPLYEKNEDARHVLASNPEDPQANEAMGRFDCFEKGDWVHGLPQLARGDGPFRDLAPHLLLLPGTPQALAELGKKWAAAAKTLPMKQQAAAMRGAVTAFQECIARGASGMELVEIEAALRKIGSVGIQGVPENASVDYVKGIHEMSEARWNELSQKGVRREKREGVAFLSFESEGYLIVELPLKNHRSITIEFERVNSDPRSVHLSYPVGNIRVNSGLWVWGKYGGLSVVDKLPIKANPNRTQIQPPMAHVQYSWKNSIDTSPRTGETHVDILLGEGGKPATVLQSFSGNPSRLSDPAESPRFAKPYIQILSHTPITVTSIKVE